MPLINSATKKAREENIEKEIEAGKPPEQAVAIGYSRQREVLRKRHERVNGK